MKPKTIEIHGKQYVPVDERVRLAHADATEISITTEFLPHETMVICKATVETKKGTFNGTSAANMSKSIEKASPYEVAETSAIGRALGFAGYGIVDGIATAEEVEKATEEAPTIELATEAQKRALRALLGPKVSIFENSKYGKIDDLTKAHATKFIDHYKSLEKKKAEEGVQDHPDDTAVVVEGEEIRLEDLPF